MRKLAAQVVQVGLIQHGERQQRCCVFRAERRGLDETGRQVADMSVRQHIVNDVPGSRQSRAASGPIAGRGF